MFYPVVTVDISVVFFFFFFVLFCFFFFFFFKQKTAYEMCGRDWSSDVCSSDLKPHLSTAFTHVLYFMSRAAISTCCKQNKYTM